ncbi:MAG: site-2 protease family protein [Ignavibacteriae bacterium]|nr:MAG: site-2 protease family protein [Ignavibacteriota bacterium]
MWAGVDPSEITHWTAGLTYAVLIMTFLSVHEFGHYTAARIHGVDATLPYYIPAPFVLFGTMGAVIRTRTAIPNRRVLFDVGVAGPLAGFVASLVILGIGYATLPPFESIYAIHPDYQLTGQVSEKGMYFGDTILFSLFKLIVGSGGGWMPPMNEIYHYPFLCVGWFGLFVTALNLAPFGNLDGGHVLYALVGGPWQRRVARFLWWVLFTIGILSLLGTIDAILREPSPDGFVIWLQTMIGAPLATAVDAFPLLFTIGEGWLLWAVLIRFLIKIDHPELPPDEGLTSTRKALGWLSFVIFVLCLPPQIIRFVE